MADILRRTWWWQRYKNNHETHAAAPKLNPGHLNAWYRISRASCTCAHCTGYFTPTEETCEKWTHDLSQKIWTLGFTMDWNILSLSSHALDGQVLPLKVHVDHHFKDFQSFFPFNCWSYHLPEVVHAISQTYQPTGIFWGIFGCKWNPRSYGFQPPSF